MSLLDPVLDLFRGRTITVPPLDGAFRPNTRLEDARVSVTLDAPDCLTLDAMGRVVVASGAKLLQLDPVTGHTRQLASFEAPVSALTSLGANGLLAGLDDGRFVRLGPDREPETFDVSGLTCATALLALGEDRVLVAQGSSVHRPSEWARDLLQGNRSGALWSLNLRDRSARLLAGNLAYASGLAVAPDRQSVIVAESWRHRLIRIPLSGGRPEPVLTALPGYPARLSPASQGGWWLALFAPRNRLVEFVLEEPRYLQSMLAEVPPEHWIAPALSPTRSFLDPLQCGAVRTMGVSKAWAPSRSYGLVVRLDERFRPVDSFHSRANGRRHGVTDMLEQDGRLLVAAKGAGMVLEVEISR